MKHFYLKQELSRTTTELRLFQKLIKDKFEGKYQKS